MMNDTVDGRLLEHGRTIPALAYVDQVYVVRADDDAWVTVLTTGSGEEGEAGQHLVIRRSADQGATWGGPIYLEPIDGPEASYAVLLKVPGGRLYAFYNHNTDNVRQIEPEPGAPFTADQRARVDCLGHFVFKYSDDHGLTWSARRYEIPIRLFECDRTNVYGGALRFFWNVGRPFVGRDETYLPHIKVGAMGVGFYAQSEGVLLASPNLATERNPEKILFETRPEGERGLRTPDGGGRVAEEQSVVELSDGSLYCVYRTIDGWPACAYSRDGGRTWTPPAYKTYGPGGRRFKHPRAANFVWKCENGRYLYWFHHHGLERKNDPQAAYLYRNPAWLSAGREVAGPDGLRLEWSPPEIALYDDDPLVRMSYPDLVEEGGRYFLTETQKTIARIHELDPRLAELLFSQHERNEAARNGLLREGCPGPDGDFEMPPLPSFLEARAPHAWRGTPTRNGFTLEFAVTAPDAAPGRVFLDTRTPAGHGLRVETGAGGRLSLRFGDGQTEAFWESTAGAIVPGRTRHVVLAVDGGPRIVRAFFDGIEEDGGEERPFGWGRFSPGLISAQGAPRAAVDRSISRVRVYGRALTAAEAAGNFRSGF